MVLDLCVPQNQYFITYNFNVQRAITQKRSGGDISKHGGAQNFRLGNIPVKFQGSRPNGS